MFNFLKPRTEYGKMAQTMNGMYLIIQTLIPKIQKTNNIDSFNEDVLVLAYIARKGVLDRMEKNNWAWETYIIVPSISRKVTTLFDAFAKTVGEIDHIAEQLDLTDIVNEIMEKGDAFYQLERSLPESAIKNI